MGSAFDLVSLGLWPWESADQCILGTALPGPDL